MEKALARIAEITSDPYSYVASLKNKKGKKIIGCFPMHVPEELVYASGMLPVVIWRGNKLVTWGHAHVPPYNCGITRSFIDDAVRGELHFMDGMVFHVRQCLQAGEFPLIMERNVKPDYMEILYLPPIYEGEAVTAFLLDDLKSFMKSLETFSGNHITEEKLINSIKIYNENRKLLERVYELRRKNPELLKAKQVMQIVWSSMLMPKEDNNELLKKLIQGMEKTKGKGSQKKIRVIPVGCLCQTLQFDILDMIEDLGMVMPDDDFYVGSRYFANPIELDGVSPLEAIAERYMKKTPVCPTKSVWQVHWADEVTKKVRENHAQGVINIIVKYCPPHSCYYPDFKSVLEKNGVPQTMIEMEHEVISFESIKTRLQSFAEILGGV
jgi:benzoyl-CoA reductase subunit C